MNSSFVLFQGTMCNQSYLDALIEIYPYDIDSALVYTLLNETSYPHPALLHFIEYVRHLHKIWVIEQMDNPTKLDDLIMRMSSISQRNQSVLHVHQFDIDVVYHVRPFVFHQPYANLSLNDITFVDQILMRHSFQLSFPNQLSYPKIMYAKSLPIRSLSIDPNSYFGVGVQIGDMQGFIFVPKRFAMMISAIAALYALRDHITTPQFLLFYGCIGTKEENLVYYDATNECYIGLSMKQSPSCSILECSQMMQSLLCLKTLKKKDLTLSSSMISLCEEEIGILFLGKDHFGKSTILQTMIDVCETNGIVFRQLFDHYGTLHILDDQLAATGSLIGALLDEHVIYKHQFQHKNAYHVRLCDSSNHSFALTPFTTYESICRFHSVHVICILDNTFESNEIERIISLEKAKTYFYDICWIEDEEIQTWYGERMESFLHQMFLNDILILRIPVKSKRYSSMHHYQKMVHSIIKEIKIIEK
ncbi:MAG: hypothetical protein HFF01_06840 [Erysipelotrichaceae bacterium]|nr:hypothetical protein [Erysipelotrichaceae bacterium]